MKRWENPSVSDPSAWVREHMPEEWPSVVDVARALGVTRNTVYRWIRSGQLYQQALPRRAVKTDPQRFASRPRYIPHAAVIRLLRERSSDTD